MESKRFKEPYEIIEKKLELAELTLELGTVTREKWKQHEGMKAILKQEEDLIRMIAEKTKAIQDMTK
jgi:hypothetical protein